jgi:hypothetical protein
VLSPAGPTDAPSGTLAALASVAGAVALTAVVGVADDVEEVAVEDPEAFGVVEVPDPLGVVDVPVVDPPAVGADAELLALVEDP